ncbi:MAG TPA: BatD family protein [Polyangia bacterium]
MRPGFRTLIPLLGLLIAGAAQAAPPSFAARVDRTQVGVGEAFTLEITLAVEGGRVDGYRAPDLRGFRILSERPSQSTQVQMGGGTTFMRQVYGWHYEVQALERGNFIIGPARVKVDREELRTDKIAMTVVENGQAQPSRRSARGLPRGIPNPGLPFPGMGVDVDEPPAAAQAGNGRRNFLRAQASKTKAYVGEEITAEWILFLTENQNRISPTAEPHTDGFWVEDRAVVRPGGGVDWSEQTLEGRSYQVATLMKKSLFPLHPGRLTITPLELEISRVDFFGATLRTERLKAEPLTIEVLPLPTAGQPPSFDSSAVGHFSLHAEVDRDHVNVGEAVTLKLAIAGQGNLRKLAAPSLPRLDGWKTYDPKVSGTLGQGDRPSGTKTVEYLLLPERAGVTTIPPFTLAFFDPERGAYGNERSNSIRIEVSVDGALPTGSRPAGTTPVAAGTSPATPGGENVLALDIRPLRNRPTLRRDLGTSFYQSRGLLAVVAIPPFALALTALFGFARERLSQETESTRRRKLRRLTRRRLRAAETHLREGRLGPAFGEIERVLRECLTGKLGRQIAGLSWDELRATLAQAGLAPALANATLAALEDCDRARFAPGSLSADEVREARDRASEIILQIEKAHLHPASPTEERA